MSQTNGKFILPDSVNDLKIKLRNVGPLRSRNAADSADVNLLQLDSSNIMQLMTRTQIATTPSSSNDVVNKTYVDTAISSGSGSTWLSAVLDGPLNTPPGSPSSGDRYLVGTSPTGLWAGHANAIAYYTTSWNFTIPSAGSFVNVNTYTAGFYVYSGSAWAAKDFEETTASTGLQKVGVDIQPKFETSNPTLQNASGSLAVKLDGFRAITSGASGIGVNLEASNPTLQVATNQLGVKLDSAAPIVTSSTGLVLQVEASNPSLQVVSNRLGVKLDAAGAIVSGSGGVAVQLESVTPTLQIATNKLGVKLNGSGAITTGASGVGVNLESSNPTLQIATNQLGVKLNASGSIVTGASGLAVQVDGVTVKINGSNQLEGLKPTKESFTLSATNITNGYIDLSHVVQTGSVLFFATGLLQLEGTDYTLSTVSSVTRVTFAGDLTAAGTALVSGDKITVAYSYL
jgi:hypothetical protein